MPRVKEIRNCIRCGEPFHRTNGNVTARYCSRTCACRDRNTSEHQKIAGRAGATHNIQKRGSGTKGYVKENGRHQHRIVAETALGRKLKKGEIVHHRDGDKHNNAPENLQVMTQSEHAKIHAENRKH